MEISAVAIYPRNVTGDAFDPVGNQNFDEEASGLNYVVASAAKKYKVVIPDYSSGVGIDGLVEKINRENPNVLLVSAETMMLPISQKIIRKVRQHNDPLTVIGGGSHFVTGRLEDEFDFVVRGEGEQTIVELLDAISRNDDDFSNINGITYKQGNQLQKNPARIRNKNLDSLPFPYRPDNVLENKIYGSLVFPALADQQGLASITASRGCIYDCSFCPNEQAWGTGKSAVEYRSVDNVIEELAYLRRRFETNIVFFNDLNITYDRKWMKKFCEKKIEFDKEGKIYWYGMSNISTARDVDLLQQMYVAGCVRLMFGIETVDPATMGKSNEGYEHKYQSYKRTSEVLKKSQEAGIFNHGFLMIGLPEDSSKSVRRCIPQIRDLPLHSIRVSTNTPFVGTNDYRKHLITDKNLKHHDGSRLVFDHPNLTESDCKQLRLEIYEGFYGSTEYAQRMQRFLQVNPDKANAFTSFINSNIVTKDLVYGV